MAEESIAAFEPEGDYDEEAESKLAKQDLETLDITQLTPLSHQIISRQATINIGKRSVCCELTDSGTIGHVAHGKSTVVKAISSVKVCSRTCQCTH
jgi:hypothetical protein